MPVPLRILILGLMTLCVHLAQAQLSVDGIETTDRYHAPDGYYLFAPESVDPSSDSLGLVVFIHGYGGLNPLNYGAWLRHMVDEGNVVIYPRYQRNLLLPGTKKFAHTVSRGIRGALEEIAASTWPVDTSSYCFVGHSYGGTLSLLLSAEYAKYKLPRPHGAVVVAPGTSRFKGGRLESYAGLDPRMPIAVISHEDDHVVGTELVELLDTTVTDNCLMRWWHQPHPSNPMTALSAQHNECYALDMAFDSGLRNFTTKRALRIGRLDVIDTNLLWPITDQLLASAKTGDLPRWATNQVRSQFEVTLGEARDSSSLVLAKARGRNAKRWAAPTSLDPSSEDLTAPSEHVDRSGHPDER